MSSEDFRTVNHTEMRPGQIAENRCRTHLGRLLRKSKPEHIGIVDTSVLRSFVKPRTHSLPFLTVSEAWNVERGVREAFLDRAFKVFPSLSFPREVIQEYDAKSNRLRACYDAFDGLNYWWSKSSYSGRMPTDLPDVEDEKQKANDAFSEFCRYNTYFRRFMFQTPTEALIDADSVRIPLEHAVEVLSPLLIPGKEVKRHSTDVRIFYKAMCAADKAPTSIITRDKGYLGLLDELYANRNTIEPSYGVPFPRHPLQIILDKSSTPQVYRKTD